MLGQPGESNATQQTHLVTAMLDIVILAQETVQLNLRLNGFLALIAGILVFAIPRFLNYIVGAYLILIGLIDLFNIRVQ